MANKKQLKNYYQSPRRDAFGRMFFRHFFAAGVTIFAGKSLTLHCRSHNRAAPSTTWK